ncbi:hypothetical protein [Paenisporosarcina antarctica]|uniref:Translation initiation factor 2 n=1 Tax=Paenisporosarcina antarctica TaxID=417367 RepID=A0A4P7A045_9BACL|nr:hypothetical protein [Paenisporosarcina antarctica]QBP41944.1 hypothetical protein E2636_12625 [Paenisporosarcina antarctica]
MEKNNVNNGESGQNSTFPEIYSAKLAIIASVISTFGDALATVAGVLALEEAVEDNIQDTKNQINQENQENQMKKMQKQIDYLTNQLTQINKKLS